MQKLGVKDIYPYEATSDESLKTLVNLVNNRHLDVLINNAGIYYAYLGIFKTVETRKEMLAMYDVNCVAPYLLTRALLGSLKLPKGFENEGVASKVVFVSASLGSISATQTKGMFICPPSLITKAFC